MEPPLEDDEDASSPVTEPPSSPATPPLELLPPALPLLPLDWPPPLDEPRPPDVLVLPEQATIPKRVPTIAMPATARLIVRIGPSVPAAGGAVLPDTLRRSNAHTVR